MSLMVSKVKIRGTRKFLYHVFTEDTLSLERKKLTGVAGNNPEEWKKTYTADENGQLYIKPTYIFGCLREASRYTKDGRISIQPKLSASLQVLNHRIYFNRFLPKLESITRDENEPVYLDVSAVNIPRSKAKNIRYRLALSPGWETEFEFLWDNSLVSDFNMMTVIFDAGKLIGLGDGRTIGNGRFEILSVETEEYENQMEAKSLNA